MGFGAGFYFNRIDVVNSRFKTFAIAALELEQRGVQTYLRLTL